MGKYMRQIEKAESLDELNDVIEKAAFDYELPNIDFCKVYKVAMEKAQSWLPI